MKRPFYNAIHSLLFNQEQFIDAILKRCGGWLPDELYIRWHYYLNHHRRINLTDPKRYTEKLQWLKLYYRDSFWTKLVDKYRVKELVRERIGDEYVVPCYGVWNRTEDIDWDKLPEQFVLKTNHDSGNNGVFICRDKAKIDKVQWTKKINASLKRDTSIPGREWPYRDVKRCVFAEQYLEDASGELRDYKFFCFNGVVKYLFIATERQSGGEVKFNYFDADFNALDIVQRHPMSDKKIEKPAMFEQMKKIAAKLSEGLPEVRVDLYEVNGRIYFGEYTFFHHGGIAPFHPDKWDLIWGENIILPDKNNNI